MCKKKFAPLGEPLNSNERVLYGIAERLEYIAELLESKEEVKVEEVKEVVAEVAKPSPRRRKAKEV